MKLSKNKLALAILAATAVGVAGLGTAGIKDSKHNLGSTTGTGKVNTFSGTSEICVFCHTPHAADEKAPVPLWNKQMSNQSVYKTYDQLGTSSLDGSVASVGSVSLACLSCHDGTQAMDTVINEPGSGKTVAAYSTGSNWTGSSVNTGNVGVGDAGKMLGSVIAALGTDLTNDHPVGIQYCGGGYDGTDTGVSSTVCRDKDFKNATYVSLNNNPVWYVETYGVVQSVSGATGSRDKHDMQLYTRGITDVASLGAAYDAGKDAAGTTLAGGEPFVECASCHDPHQSETATFLRINNAGSAVCLACHTK